MSSLSGTFTHVADTIIIYDTEIHSLILRVLWKNRLQNTGKELERSLACLSTKLRLTEGNVLGSVCKALALGLVSSSVSHVNRLTLNFWKYQSTVLRSGQVQHSA